MTPPIIEVEHLTKEFRLGQLSGLGQNLRDGLARLRGKDVAPRQLFKALDDVSFTIRQGEVVGIIGHNGAGKSTLLKTLAGISQATRGRVAVHGRVAPLIEVGAGLVSEMTGRENIFLNGAILGMSRRDIRRKFDEIVDFAEMEKFIDTPVKRYSSGMQIRLAFAIATAVESEVLIVDEVLAVGDLAFQRKCYDRIDSFVRSGERTLLLVSHNLRQVERLCTRVLMLNRGKLVMDGDPKPVCDAFLNQNNAKIVADRKAAAAGRFESSGEIKVITVKVGGARDATLEGTVVSGDDVVVEVEFEATRPLEELMFTMAIHTTDLFFIAVTSSETRMTVPSVAPGRARLRCRLAGVALTPGAYAIHFSVESGAANSPIFRADNVATFQVQIDSSRVAPVSERLGTVCADAHWQLDGSGRGHPVVAAEGLADAR